MFHLKKRIEAQQDELEDDLAIKELIAVLTGEDPDAVGASQDSIHTDHSQSGFRNVIGKKHLYCVVFSQGGATAQGGHVLALLVNTQTKKAKIDSIQCKYYKRKETPETCRNWWASLGVDLKADGSSNFHPESGSAGYYYAGLLAFRDLLLKRLGPLGLEIEIGTRILAASFPTPPDFEMPRPGDGDFRVWFREMFEPTISVIEPRSPK